MFVFRYPIPSFPISAHTKAPTHMQITIQVRERVIVAVIMIMRIRICVLIIRFIVSINVCTQ